MKKMFILVVLTISLFLASSSFAGDFHQTSKEDFLSDMQELSEKMLELRAEAKAMTERWFGNGFQAGATYEMTAAQLAGTQFEGMTIQEIYNLVGSLEAYETWMGTHGVNFHMVTK